MSERPRHPDLLVIRQKYTPYGGAERFVTAAMESLAEQGLKIAILTRKWPQSSAFTPIIRNPFHIGRQWRDRGFADAACDYVNATPGTLVQSHERVSCCDIYRAGDGVHKEWLVQRARAAETDGKNVTRLTPYHRYTVEAEKKLFSSQRLSCIICNSEMVRDEIRLHYGVAPDRLRIIRNGVDSDAFHPNLRLRHNEAVRSRLQIPQEATVFLMVGSGFERKGVPVLLKALSRLSSRPHLLLVGKSRQPGKYRRMAKTLDIADRVHFLGPQRDPRPFYGAADAFVLPALYDPAPNVVLEAMACALPVAVSSKTGTVDLIQEGENGLVCDALDADTLAGFMDALLDRPTRQSLGQRGRETVIPWSFKRMSGAYQALYKELLSS